MFLQLDGTFFVQLINFLIFFGALNWLFLKPVGQAIRRRRAYIDSVRDDYERFVHQSKELRAQADAKRAAARREAEELVAVARTGANADAQATIEGYGNRAGELVADAHRTVEAEVSRARARTPQLAAALGASLLARAVGESVA